MKKQLGHRIFAVLVVLGVFSVIVTGLVVSGSPAQERARRLDAQRSQDLQAIRAAIDMTWTDSSRLPVDLPTLQQLPNVYLNEIRDPKTGQPYEYAVKDAGRYQLCAIFETDTTTVTDEAGRGPVYAPPPFDKHPVGHACFDLAPSPNQLIPPKP